MESILEKKMKFIDQSKDLEQIIKDLLIKVDIRLDQYEIYGREEKDYKLGK